MIFEMAEYSSKNSDGYKREIDKLTSTTNTIDQPTTSEKINPDERDTKESEIQGRKSESIKDKISRIISEFVEETKSEGKEKGSSFGIKSIILGLFVLIGFIILVYSIFVAVVGEPLTSTADTIFIAALIGSFTLIGIIVSLLFLKPIKSL
jgi:hypothetical protein